MTYGGGGVVEQVNISRAPLSRSTIQIIVFFFDRTQIIVRGEIKLDKAFLLSSAYAHDICIASKSMEMCAGPNFYRTTVQHTS
jgi:hypothetical protein